MELLESYLRAVKRYLPRAQSTDIIRELSDELRSQLDEKETVLGRPMTDEEVVAFLKQHGDPMTVARRYRQDSPSLTIGWELIGPELFPMYLIMLSVNLVITLASVAIVFLSMHAPITLSIFVFPVVVQIIVLTLVFIGFNLVRRKYPQPWYLPARGAHADAANPAGVLGCRPDLVGSHPALVVGTAAFPVSDLGFRRRAPAACTHVAQLLCAHPSYPAGLRFATSDQPFSPRLDLACAFHANDYQCYWRAGSLFSRL
jgi:hypothetical protein